MVRYAPPTTTTTRDGSKVHSWRACFELQFGAFIGIWVSNLWKLSLHQLDFCSSIYWILNGKRSTSANYKIWLWRLRFPWYSLFYFFCLSIPERYGCYLLNVTGITSFRSLELPLCTKHRLKVKSVNQLQLPPFCIFHPKMPSKHKTKNIKAFYTQNICKTLGKYRWNYQIIWSHQISPRLALARPRERIGKKIKIKIKITMINLSISHQYPIIQAL